MSSTGPGLRPPLGAGGHLCCAYGAEDEWAHGAAAFVGEGLTHGRQVVYCTDTAPDAVVEALSRGGVDAGDAAARGRLVFRTAGPPGPPRRPFDPDRTLGMWSEECARALSRGYAGLCVVGEMSRRAQDPPELHRLLEYELRLTVEKVARLPLTALCLYDRRAVPGDAVALLATAHTGHVHPQGSAAAAGAAACRLPLSVAPLAGRPGLRLRGGADSDTRPVWRAAVAALARMSEDVVHLDLSETDFLDTGAVADLVAASEARRQRGRRLVLHHPPRSLRRMAELLPDECGTLETAV